MTNILHWILCLGIFMCPFHCSIGGLKISFAQEGPIHSNLDSAESLCHGLCCEDRSTNSDLARNSVKEIDQEDRSSTWFLSDSFSVQIELSGGCGCCPQPSDSSPNPMDMDGGCICCCVCSGALGSSLVEVPTLDVSPCFLSTIDEFFQVECFSTHLKFEENQPPICHSGRQLRQQIQSFLI